MFIDNKYTKWYYAIIEQAKNKDRVKLDKEDSNYVYYESHHIIPRALDPELVNDLNNIVLLTAREHFICHCLLVKMLTGQSKYKMQAALIMMCGTKTEVRYKNSRLYELLRKDMKLTDEHKQKIALAGRGRKHSEETKQKISEANKGVPKTEEHKQKLRGIVKSEETRKKLSEAHKGKPSPKKGLPGVKHTEEYKQDMSKRVSGELNPFYGKTHSDETKQRMKDSWDRRRLDKLECPHCGKIVCKSPYKRWHGDNCKLATVNPV